MSYNVVVMIYVFAVLLFHWNFIVYSNYSAVAARSAV